MLHLNPELGQVRLVDTTGNPSILCSIFSFWNFSNFGVKILVRCSAKSLQSFLFHNFVFSWYILVQSLIKRLPKWIYFSFFYYQVAYICLIKTTGSFSKASILTNKDHLVLFFSGGCILLVNQKRKLPIRFSYFTNIAEVIVFWANKNFSIKHHAEKQNKNKKLNVRRSQLNSQKILKID